MLSAMSAPPRLALVGDRSPLVRSHVRIPVLLDAAARLDGLVVDAYWLATEEVGDVAAFDGVWLLPGSPYRSLDGALAAARAAREGGIPFLGTCGGFQHAMLEFARTVCGLDVDHAEASPDAPAPLVVPLACSLVGHEGAVEIEPGSRAERILGARRTVERYHCSYGLDRAYTGVLTRHGVRFTGHDDAGEPRIAELPEHPFYLATLFQPELAGDGTEVHPIVRAFLRAVVEHASAQPSSSAELTSAA
jgi:CTP synthase (UTP-ammonia lyase)